MKDTKTPGKKKRNQSSEDEAKASGSATVVSQKGGKKQKVNQEKETRKGVKVIFIESSNSHLVLSSLLTLVHIILIQILCTIVLKKLTKCITEIF